MPELTAKKFVIGTWVKIVGAGSMRAIVVDYCDLKPDRYVVAVQSGLEFELAEGQLIGVDR